METLMPKVFERYAGPRSVWVFPGVSDNKLNEYKAAIEQTPQDEDLAFNPAEGTSFDIKTLAIDPRARFEGFVNYIESQYIAGMQTPVVKLYTAPGFTEASATVAKEISERKIDFLRRFLKRVVEREIYADLLKSNGFDPIKDRVTFNWGIERPEITFPDLVTLAQISAQTAVAYVTKEEVRGMLRKFGVETSEAQQPEQKQQQEEKPVSKVSETPSTSQEQSDHAQTDQTKEEERRERKALRDRKMRLHEKNLELVEKINRRLEKE
jgi:hypothetical protein